jgi:DNA polymerase III delta prime subunit
MSRRGRAAIKSIVLDDSDEEETQNGNKSVLVPGKLSFTRAPGLKNPKPESSKPSKVEHKGGNDLHFSNTIADTGDAFGSGSPSQRIATIDISGDDILGFDVFAKTNKPVSYLVESQDQELSSEILLEDESASKPQKRKRLRKGDPSSASESGLSPRKGKSSRRQQDEDDDFQPTYVQDDEPIVPAKSKKRQRATGKSAAAEIDANTSSGSGQLDFVALPQLHVSPKASTSSLSSLSKQSTIVSTFQRMMAQKNSAPPPMQPVRAPSDDDIIIVESVKPAPVPSAKSKSSEPVVAASPKRKFSVSRAAPASSDDFELYSQASKDSNNNAILIKSTESLRYSSSGTEEPKANDGGQVWTSKYSPASREQLAVPAKKVQEFADLIIQAIQDSKMPTPVGEIDRRLKMIVVQGPPGSGKTAALKVLSRSLSELSGAPSEFNYLEWRNQVVSRSSYGMEIGNRPSHVQYEPPLLDTFFMWLSGRRKAGVLHFEAPESFEGYVFLTHSLCVSIYSHISAFLFSSHIGNSEELPLLVVEDLPNVFTLPQKQQFQAEIRASLHTNPYKPVVWIISDDAGGQSPVRTLFGEDFLTSPHVKSVTFRPVTKKNALQALRRILESEKANATISDADLNAIVEIADGDLRSAINSLQWLSNTHQQPSNLMSEPAPSKSKSKSKKPVKKSKVESSGANLVRYASLGC